MWSSRGGCGTCGSRACGSGVAEARFVEAFSCVGNACMVNPQLAIGQPTMFIYGNDEAAKKTVDGARDARAMLDSLAAELGRSQEPASIGPTAGSPHGECRSGRP